MPMQRITKITTAEGQVYWGEGSDDHDHVSRTATEAFGPGNTLEHGVFLTAEEFDDLTQMNFNDGDEMYDDIYGDIDDHDEDEDNIDDFEE